MTIIVRNAGLPMHFLDDIFNESLEEVWKIANKGQKISNFNSFFIYQIFKKNVLNFAQKERLRETVGISNSLSKDFSHDNLFESIVEADHIEYFLNLMEPNCRQIIRLYIEGYSNEEMSKIMQLQKNTISTYKSKCFDKLENLISSKL
ncbi:MAG: sigma-70 family RNA polymerase sigma factor [Saprospiraceae bacterium]|nr:sigma-70 family RNA polymerase sigma factor [Saprospiraceae bacterium]